jgi:S1-C subfamily serine protease
MQKPDLAVLQCESLQAPAIPLRKQFPGRGADLMVLGYPKGRLLGLGIKSTRGSVIAMPDAGIGGFLHSAMSARGNSGGPIVDQSGSLIGVVVGGFEFQENTYSIGISVDEVWPFVSQHVPDFTGAEPSKAMPSWTDVDAMVSQSAVFIQVKKRLNSRSDE